MLPTPKADLGGDSGKSSAAVITTLRKALTAAFPISSEKYLTVALPGTVLDLRDAEAGGPFLYDVERHAVPPASVRQAEARLVDGMIPIASITTGNQGKSVALSYLRALDAMISRQLPISSLPDHGYQSPSKMSYEKAMAFLKRNDPNDRLVLDVYRKKQEAWSASHANWEEARRRAEHFAEQKFPPSPGTDFMVKRKESINKWNQEHHPRYKAETQAAWMDWVVSGNKYEVDHASGIVDVDSIMGRIENSKESLRDSAIPDESNGSELYSLNLTPSGWATFCKCNTERWSARHDNGGTKQQLEHRKGDDSVENSQIWTTINFSYPATSEGIATEQSNLSTSINGSLGDIWSLGGAEPHGKSSNARKEMASCDVRVSFSAMVVHINRPWLHDDLFSDIDVDVVGGITISPGITAAKEMVDYQKADGSRVDYQFPAYPASFIVATNTTVEFSGSTKDIEEYFLERSNPGGLPLGFGPWSASSSSHESGPGQHLQMQTTPAGCKLFFGAPQVIAWISNILPALPRQNITDP